ncbi:alpha/beta hydrolase [Asticcacaulis sp. 201]|uniref:alpha/beta hydrolase family protein n=1 Tax=Asticcacaulis sp. 201 TaxID=3028787 RepID=UPI0029166157|nr:alpha/beta hydrolase [Asticcacaulis sp. 201]MDV6332397.1 alpha/beta hydrolase [Asticcacaulis sp. 201]
MKKLSILVGILALASGPALAEEAAGDWGGILGGQLHVIVHIKKNGAAYSGTLESPDQGAVVIPIDTITTTPDHLAFSIAAIHGSYDGKWDDAQKTWTGTWTQGQAMPLTLKRLDPAAKPTPIARPQEQAISVGPNPYTASEVTFDSRAAGVKLAGTFSVPNGKGPFPAVVLIAGSGPHTRDEDVFNHKIFVVLTDALNRAGIAVLRYDKRGIGQSSGNYKTATTTDFTTDATAAVEWLKSRPEVNKSRIGLIGHSEGGLIAPTVAVADPSVAFVVLMAGPGLPGDTLLLMQQAAIARASGESEAAIATAQAMNRQAFDVIKASSSPEDAQGKVKTLMASLVASGQITQAQADAAVTQLTSPWGYEFLRYDPRPTLSKVKVPVLAINGGLDRQVPPKEDLEEIRQALKDNRDVTVTELPGLNHLFQTAKTGAPSEYGQIEETVAPVALKIITDWVSAHSK